MNNKLKNKQLDNLKESEKAKYQPLLDEKDKIVNEKDMEIVRIKVLLNIDVISLTILNILSLLI